MKKFKGHFSGPSTRPTRPPVPSNSKQVNFFLKNIGKSYVFHPLYSKQVNFFLKKIGKSYVFHPLYPKQVNFFLKKIGKSYVFHPLYVPSNKT